MGRVEEREVGMNIIAWALAAVGALAVLVVAGGVVYFAMAQRFGRHVW